MLLDVSVEISQRAEWKLTAFLFQSSAFRLPLPGVLPLFFLDHLVIVTRSSTGTSLISCLEELIFCNSRMGWTDGAVRENDEILPGEDWMLLSGLI